MPLRETAEQPKVQISNFCIFGRLAFWPTEKKKKKIDNYDKHRDEEQARIISYASPSSHHDDDDDDDDYYYYSIDRSRPRCKADIN